jgi:hypothetical protein
MIKRNESNVVLDECNSLLGSCAVQSGHLHILDSHNPKSHVTLDAFLCDILLLSNDTCKIAVRSSNSLNALGNSVRLRQRTMGAVRETRIPECACCRVAYSSGPQGAIFYNDTPPGLNNISPTQPESQVYLQVCYPHPTEARLPFIPARIKPDLFTNCPNNRNINTCFSIYKCQ